MNLSYVTNIKNKAFHNDKPGILKTLVIVFLSHLVMTLVTLYWAKKIGKSIELPLTTGDATVIKSIFGVISIIISLGQVIAWIVVTGILFMIFRFLLKKQIEMKFKNFLNLWGMLLPVKAIVFCVIILSLTALAGGTVTDLQLLKQWQVATERVNFFSNIVYGTSVAYFLYQQFKQHLTKVLIATFTPFLVTYSITLIAK